VCSTGILAPSRQPATNNVLPLVKSVCTPVSDVIPYCFLFVQCCFRATHDPLRVGSGTGMCWEHTLSRRWGGC
jgi:hypothetical protein